MRPAGFTKQKQSAGRGGQGSAAEIRLKVKHLSASITTLDFMFA
jgi:hypothetical protein